MIERWSRSLKVKQLYPNEYDSPRDLRRLVSRYVEEYNDVRPHEALEYRTPSEVYDGYFSASVADIA